MITNILTLLLMLDPATIKPLLEILENPKTIELLKATIISFIDSSGRFNKGELKKELENIKATSSFKW